MRTVFFDRVVRKTEKAVLCDFQGIAIWLPLSKCKFYYHQASNNYKCEMPEWLFQAKGFNAKQHNGRDLFLHQ